jgi:hypothetical protein
MGKRTQCCLKVSRSSSSSSSSDDLCPTVVAGQVTTSFSLQNSNPTYQTVAQGAVTAVTQPFAISGVPPPASQTAYVTPLACKKGVAQGVITYGTVYLVNKNATGAAYPYNVIAPVANETSGVSTSATAPVTFQVKLKRNQALIFLPFAASPTTGTATFIYNYYPQCSTVPCVNVTALPYM